MAVQPLEEQRTTETEQRIEELLVTSPDVLMPDLTLIGRQAQTAGGPLDHRLHKLPRWFVVDTPVGGYNPDWAILKDDGQATLYLVKETKSTMDFTKLRTAEADKVNCCRHHFDAIGVPFSVVVRADQV